MTIPARLAAGLVALLLLAPPAGAADRFDLGPGVSEYRRFLVYPHLQKGFAALADGRRDTALAELGRAREILPGNPVVAVYYADALARFGDLTTARRVLEQQRRVTPDNARVLDALDALPAGAIAATSTVAGTSARAPARLAASAATSAATATAGTGRATPPAAAPLLPTATATAARPGRAGTANAASAAPARNDQGSGPAPVPGAPPPVAPAPAAEAPAAAAPGPVVSTTADVAPASATAGAINTTLATLAATAPASTAAAPAVALPRPTPAPASALHVALEIRSYQLLTAGQRREALQLLLADYPFAGAAPELRLGLLQRIALLAADPALFDAAARERLAPPLETAPLRGAQAAIFAALQDCAGVRQLLGDLAPEYGPDDWRRLGDCYRDSQPGLAQHAYAMAWKRHPDGQSARALAYQAFANHDYPAALEAWRSLTPETLTADDLMAGITTAVTAGDTALARAWLEVQARRFGTDSEAYWWRLAQAQAAQSPAQAEAAVREAIARQPRLDYYLLLAALQQRAGADDAALATLRAALAQEPGNTNVQLQLAYACEHAGRLDEARTLFEAVHTARPGDRQLTEQLVYLAERQGDLAAARRYAGAAVELRLANPPAAIGADAAEADTLFGLRRLHEDLGRRWNINADLFTGAGLVSAGTAPSSRTTYRSYLQVEAEYRLEADALPPRLLAPYVRVFAGSGEEDSALPVYSPMLGAGLRLRPWRRLNVALALEQQLPLDHGPDTEVDVMLRASGSFLDGGRFSGDWHASGRGWTSQSLYLDVAHFVDARRSAGSADYRLGHHRKTGNGRTVEPYGHLQYNVIDADGRDEDVRAGIGLRWNRWLGETRLDAWRHKASIGLEYQHAFQSWLTDKDSLALSIGLHW